MASSWWRVGARPAASTPRRLAIRRTLADALGTPTARRDLAVSLDRLGAVAMARSDWDNAQTLFAESLDIARTLADSLGTPAAQRDLAVSCYRVGEARGRNGDTVGQRSLYAEMVQLLETVARATGLEQDQHWAEWGRRQLQALEP